MDTELAARVEAAGLGTRDDVITTLRARASEEFAWLAQEKGADRFGPMIVESMPFVEIVKIAKDLQDVDDGIASRRKRSTQGTLLPDVYRDARSGAEGTGERL